MESCTLENSTTTQIGPFTIHELTLPNAFYWATYDPNTSIIINISQSGFPVNAAGKVRSLSPIIGSEGSFACFQSKLIDSGFILP